MSESFIIGFQTSPKAKRKRKSFRYRATTVDGKVCRGDCHVPISQPRFLRGGIVLVPDGWSLNQAFIVQPSLLSYGVLEDVGGVPSTRMTDFGVCVKRDGAMVPVAFAGDSPPIHLIGLGVSNEHGAMYRLAMDAGACPSPWLDELAEDRPSVADFVYNTSFKDRNGVLRPVVDEVRARELLS